MSKPHNLSIPETLVESSRGYVRVSTIGLRFVRNGYPYETLVFRAYDNGTLVNLREIDGIKDRTYSEAMRSHAYYVKKYKNL